MHTIKIAAIVVIASSLCMVTSIAGAQRWENDIDNWKNSFDNWENSPDNWKNSPDNWKNSSDNYNGENGIYGSDGKRIGYGVIRSDGSGINYYDNSGTPLGFQNFGR